MNKTWRKIIFLKLILLSKLVTGINNQDQHDLRLVFKDHKLMKRIITLLDQKPEVNKDKPTFHSLGRYLGDSPDEVYHFE